MLEAPDYRPDLEWSVRVTTSTEPLDINHDVYFVSIYVFVFAHYLSTFSELVLKIAKYQFGNNVTSKWID